MVAQEVLAREGVWWLLWSLWHNLLESRDSCLPLPVPRTPTPAGSVRPCSRILGGPATLHALGPVRSPAGPAPPHSMCTARGLGAMATVLTSVHRWLGKAVTTALGAVTGLCQADSQACITWCPLHPGAPRWGKTWAVELGQLRHSPKEPQCWEGEEDGKALRGFPGRVSAEASQWLRLLVANQEPCRGNGPLSNPTTAAPFCKVVAALPAQPGHKAHARSHSRVWSRPGWGLSSFLVYNKLNSALHSARQLLFFRYSSLLPLALLFRIKDIGFLVCTLRMQGGTWNTG